MTSSMADCTNFNRLSIKDDTQFGQQAREKMLNVIIHQENTNENNEIQDTPNRLVKMKKTDNTKG